MSNESYPSIPEQTKNLALSVLQQMRDTAATGSVIAEQEVQKQRREICYACEFHDPEQHRCKSCGCMLSVKISMSANSCPQNKWPK